MAVYEPAGVRHKGFPYQRCESNTLFLCPWLPPLQSLLQMIGFIVRLMALPQFLYNRQPGRCAPHYLTVNRKRAQQTMGELGF
jgi:hypothetical protein